MEAMLPGKAYKLSDDEADYLLRKRKGHLELVAEPKANSSQEQVEKETSSSTKRKRIWITDGRQNKLVFPDAIPDGYRKGRVKK